ncbi:MAG TPA: ABC transporter permease, partial [Anaerolineaceae bacterium]|nr:ABC transporter permease [Anaerolineaceae bacterium]
MNIAWKLAWQYLTGHKLRTFLTTLAIVLGVMIIFGLNAMIPALERVVARQMMAAVSEVELSVRSTSGNPFEDQTLEVVQAASGVGSATGILSQPLIIPDSLVRPAVADYQPVKSIVVVGVDPATVAQVRAFSIQAGRFLQSADGQAVLISESLAEKLDLRPDDVWTLPAATGTVDLTVVGVYAPAMPVIGSEEIYVPLEQAQQMFNLPGQINTIEAVLDANADNAAVSAAVQSRLGSTYSLIAPDGDSEFSSAVAVGQSAFLLFGILALAMGGFVIFNTFRTVVAERRRDIGLLRAVGASRRTIVLAILFETLLQGILGTILGLVAGYLFAVAMMAVVTPLAQEFLYMEMGAPIVTPENLAISLVLGVGVTVLAGLIPALSASKITPLEALRLETTQQAARKVRTRAIVGFVLIGLAVIALITGSFNLAALGAVLFLVGIILSAPVLVQPLAETFGRLLGIFFAREGQLAQRNLARQPERAAVTALAMLIGLAIVVALAGVLSSTFGGFLGYLKRSLGADYLVMPTSLVLGGGNMGAAPDLARKLAEVEGVAGVTTLRLGSGQVDGTAMQM